MRLGGRERNWATDAAGAGFAFAVEVAIVVGMIIAAFVIAYVVTNV